MEQQDILLLEYTEILLGNKQHFSDDTFSGKRRDSEKMAADFIRLVAKVYLQCDNASHARVIFTDELVEKMKLGNIMKEIEIPDYIDSSDEHDYVAARIFTPGFNPERWAAERYCDRIKNGTLYKFPRNYMDGEIGLRRAKYCLQYFLKMEMPGATCLDLLQKSLAPEFRGWLQEHLLLSVCNRCFDSRLDFVYASLPEDMKVEIFYMICKSRIMLSRAKPSLAKA